MVINANSGPYVGFGLTATSTGQIMQYNEDQAPSQFDLGAGLMDPRPFYRYDPGAGTNVNSSAAVGFAQNQTMMLWDNVSYVDYVPATLNSSNIAIAASNAPAASGALVLAAAGSSVGAITTTISPPDGNAPSSTLVALDSTAAYVTYGQSKNIVAWNPRAGTGRAILITTSSSGDGGSVFVAGRDMYGYKMTEQIFLSTATNTAASSNSAGYKWPGKKAFKYVSAVSASTTVTSTGWSVGTTDTYGFPGYVQYCGLNTIVNILPTAFSSVAYVLLSSASVSLASTAATQTSTTPDVRGTYASTTASNGTIRFQLFQGYDGNVMSNITVANTSAIFGAAQFSSV